MVAKQEPKPKVQEPKKRGGLFDEEDEAPVIQSKKKEAKHIPS